MDANKLLQIIGALSLLILLFGDCEKQFKEDPLHIIAQKQVPSTQIISKMLEKYYTSVRIRESVTSFEGIGMKTSSDLLINMEVSVDSFGAVGDGITDDTEAFEDAWTEACSSLFSVFLVPQGKMYLVKPINFSGPCQTPLTVKISGTIVAPEDPHVWKKTPNHWLLFNGVNNLAVGGGGLINGRGQKWWAQSCKINKTNPCIPAPTAVTFESINNVRVSNLIMINSQQFHLTFRNCLGVEANDLRISSPKYSPNTDGIHISASKYVTVKNSIIGTGDDCISIVSDSFDILVQNITCGPGHGISIGSLGKGNSNAEVSFVVVDSVYIHDTTNGLRIKTWQGGSGYARGITFHNIYMANVSYPIIIDQYYCDSPKQCPNQTSAVRVSEIGYFNIRGTSATEEAIRFACSESVPCENIVLENIYLTLTSGDSAKSMCENALGFSMGMVTPPPCFQNLFHPDDTEILAEVINPQQRNEL